MPHNYDILNKNNEIVWKTTNSACFAPIFQKKGYLLLYYKQDQKLLDSHYYFNKDNKLRIYFDKNINNLYLEFYSKCFNSFDCPVNFDPVLKTYDLNFKDYESIDRMKIVTHIIRGFIEAYYEKNCCLIETYNYCQKYKKANWLQVYLYLSNFYSVGGHAHFGSYFNDNNSTIKVPLKIKNIKDVIKKLEDKNDLNSIFFSQFSKDSRINHNSLKISFFKHLDKTNNKDVIFKQNINKLIQ